MPHLQVEEVARHQRRNSQQLYICVKAHRRRVEALRVDQQEVNLALVVLGRNDLVPDPNAWSGYFLVGHRYLELVDLVVDERVQEH